MNSFNRKEYLTLKYLYEVEGWVWLARDKDQTLYVYKEKPTKNVEFYIFESVGDFKEIYSENGNQFLFIDCNNEEAKRIKILIDWFERVEYAIKQESNDVRIDDLKKQIECLKFDIQNKDNLIQGLQRHNQYMEHLFIEQTENNRGGTKHE